jgi:hypothetical protein
MDNNDLNVFQIQFTVPSLQIADHLFAKAMGLKLFRKYEDQLVIYYLNPTTRIECWLHDPESKGTFGSTIYISAPKQKLLDIKAKIEKDELFAPEEGKNGKKVQLVSYEGIEDDDDALDMLNIFTPKIHTSVFITTV